MISFACPKSIESVSFPMKTIKRIDRVQVRIILVRDVDVEKGGDSQGLFFLFFVESKEVKCFSACRLKRRLHFPKEAQSHVFSVVKKVNNCFKHFQSLGNHLISWSLKKQKILYHLC